MAEDCEACWAGERPIHRRGTIYSRTASTIGRLGTERRLARWYSEMAHSRSLPLKSFVANAGSELPERMDDAYIRQILVCDTSPIVHAH